MGQIKIDDYKGMSIDTIAKRLDEDTHLLYLGGGDTEEALATLVKGSGTRAGAFFIAACLYSQDRDAPGIVGEAVSLWYESAKKCVKYKHRADMIMQACFNIEEWLAWGSVRVSHDSYVKRKHEWPVKLGELTASELFGLGNFMIYVSSDKMEGLTNSRRLGPMMAGQEMVRMVGEISRLEKQKQDKEKHKWSHEKKKFARRRQNGVSV